MGKTILNILKCPHFAALLVAYSTLRLQNPACDLDPGWVDEPIKLQAIRAVEEIYSRTVQVKGCPKRPDVKIFPAPTFAYCFYLLRSILRNGGANIGGDEKVMAQALSVISAHAQMRGNQDDMSDEVRLHH